MDAAGFAAATAVSRETLARLTTHEELLRRWNPRINLVARSTLDDVWRRHFLDSWQLVPLLGDGAGSLVDLGSGGGFPGLVLAAAGVADVRLIEADGRKCAFLREAARAMAVNVTVLNHRIDSVEPFTAAAVTARALAPLHVLLAHASRFAGPKTRCLFLKGQDVESELTQATKYWKFSFELHPSRSDARGSILAIEELRRNDDRATPDHGPQAGDR